jgi:hypothetical protein
MGRNSEEMRLTIYAWYKMLKSDQSKIKLVLAAVWPLLPVTGDGRPVAQGRTTIIY